MVKIIESELTEEFAFIKTIDVKCNRCLKTIADFANVKSVSRQCWTLYNYMLQWHVNYHITEFGEIYCECRNYLGYESGIFELRLMKKNVILDH